MNARTKKGLVYWHIIEFDGERHFPEESEIVLVFDSDLNDVVEAQALTIASEMDFYDTVTGERMPSPLWWAKKPFPNT
ncbi:MAG: hypothetical protein LWW75_05010 [Chlorobiales bacterium]|nr:hypothetical protein [Chlorobiales bacterium]